MEIVFIRNGLTTGGLGMMCLVQANYFFEQGFNVTILLDVPYKKELYTSAIYKKFNRGIKIIPTLTSSGYKYNKPKISRRGKTLPWFGGKISTYYDEYGVMIKRSWHDSTKQRVKVKIPIMEEYISNLKAGDIVIGMEASLSWYLGQISFPIGVRYMIQLHNQHFYLSNWIDNIESPNRIVCLTPKMKIAYESRYGKKDNISIVPNPLRLEIPNSIINHIERPLKIVSVGRLEDGKNPLESIKVFEKLADKYPNAYLELYGSGKLLNSLKKYISTKENLKSRVFFKGYEGDLSKIFSDASLMLFPTKREAMGLVIIEAFAYGVPVVGYSTLFGVDDLIDNGEDGYVVKQGDIVEMSKIAIKILEDVDLRNNLAMNGRLKSKKYAYDKIMPQWLNLVYSLSYIESKKIEMRLRFNLLKRLGLPIKMIKKIMLLKDRDWNEIFAIVKKAESKIINGKPYVYSNVLFEKYNIKLSDCEIV